jgi:hypothetical protein
MIDRTHVYVAGSASAIDRNRNAIDRNIVLLFCQRRALARNSVTSERRYTILRNRLKCA